MFDRAAHISLGPLRSGNHSSNASSSVIALLQITHRASTRTVPPRAADHFEKHNRLEPATERAKMKVKQNTTMPSSATRAPPGDPSFCRCHTGPPLPRASRIVLRGSCNTRARGVRAALPRRAFPFVAGRPSDRTPCCCPASALHRRVIRFPLPPPSRSRRGPRPERLFGHGALVQARLDTRFVNMRFHISFGVPQGTASSGTAAGRARRTPGRVHVLTSTRQWS